MKEKKESGMSFEDKQRAKLFALALVGLLIGLLL